jgi:glutamyl-Q tRNA(Asp) synthetase
MASGHPPTRDTKRGDQHNAPFTQYIGRFAPSPSGPLHFGSLVTALASYLDAKANQGLWLVRMEDLDPPREQPGAADLILKSLEEHHLFWDGPIFYQSQRHQVYENCLQELQKKDWVYACDCSRQYLQLTGGIYSGRCRHRQSEIKSPFSLRLKVYDLPGSNILNDQNNNLIVFDDVIQGRQTQNLRSEAGDIILKRRDGFYAYQLAVVLDDIDQKITHIIRGRDLLDVTARQIFFFQLLEQPLPQFGHLPLALMPNGQKLSKQNHAPALDANRAAENIWNALVFLGQNPPTVLAASTLDEILEWALANWQIKRVPKTDQYL